MAQFGQLFFAAPTKLLSGSRDFPILRRGAYGGAERQFSEVPKANLILGLNHPRKMDATSQTSYVGETPSQASKLRKVPQRSAELDENPAIAGRV